MQLKRAKWSCIFATFEKHELVEGENQPIGLILCTGKNEEHVELLRLDESNIRVAEYLVTYFPVLK